MEESLPRLASANAASSHIEQCGAIGLQRVAGVGTGRAVLQNLPRGAPPGQQASAELRAVNVPPASGTNPRRPLGPSPKSTGWPNTALRRYTCVRTGSGSSLITSPSVPSLRPHRARVCPGFPARACQGSTPVDPRARRHPRWRDAPRTARGDAMTVEERKSVTADTTIDWDIAGGRSAGILDPWNTLMSGMLPTQHSKADFGHAVNPHV